MPAQTNEILTPEQASGIFLASGYVHPDLAEETAQHMGVQIGPVGHKEFPNTEVYARYLDSVRDKHVIIMQSHAATADGRRINDAFVEQLLMANAARGSSAKEITVVCPYLAYSRQDRRSRGREPISVQMVLDSFAAMGVRRVVTIDLHSDQTQAAFRGPFDHLTAQDVLRKKVSELTSGTGQDECVVVAPDVGSMTMADNQRTELDLALVPMFKRRERGDSGKIKRDTRVEGVGGRVCLVFDDIIDTAGTLCTAAEVLHDSGSSRIIAIATHALFSANACERILDSPIDAVIVTDTLPTDRAKAVLGNKLHVVSVAPILGQALIEIVTGGSVSKLFQGRNYK